MLRLWPVQSPKSCDYIFKKSNQHKSQSQSSSISLEFVHLTNACTKIVVLTVYVLIKLWIVRITLWVHNSVFVMLLDVHEHVDVM